MWMEISVIIFTLECITSYRWNP